MAVKRQCLADGVYFNTISTDKFKNSYLTVNFILPLNAEDAAKNALVPAVLKRGCQKYDNLAKIAQQLQYLYDSSISKHNYKRGEMQILGLSSYMLDGRFTPDHTDVFGEMATLLCDIIFDPYTVEGAFDAEYVRSEKMTLIDDIRAQINDKNRYAVTRCYEEMCKDEAFGISVVGKEEDVEAVTPVSLFEQYRKILAEARIEIFFVGGGNSDSISEKFAAAFAKINRTPVLLPEAKVIRDVKEVREVIEDSPVAQGKLSMGFRTGAILEDGDYHKFMVFNEIFGGSPSAKLFMNVREKMSLCYYCSSSPEARKGVMMVASGIEVKNKEIAQKAILDQLDAICKGDISEDEMSAAKKSLRNAYLQLDDSVGGLESWYLGRILAGISDSPAEAAEKIGAVTVEDVVEAAKKIRLDTVYFLRGTLAAE